MQILFVIFDEATPLEVAPSDTVHDVKQRIQDRRGEFPLIQQRLIFDNRLLEDDRTLEYYNIQQDSVLDLSLYLNGNMRINVSLSAEMISLGVNPNDTVHTVKQKIHAKRGCPIYQQCLVFADELLQDRRALSNYGIHENSTLRMVPCEGGTMRVFAALSEKMIPLEVESSNTIHAVKQMVHAREGTPLDQMRLIFANKLLEDDRTLEHYDIVDGFVIRIALTSDDTQIPPQAAPTQTTEPRADHNPRNHDTRSDPTPDRAPDVSRGMPISITTLDGEPITLLVNSMVDTIESVKEKIYDVEGIPPDRQRLTFRGRQLQGGHTLHDHGIERGSMIRLRLRLR